MCSPCKECCARRIGCHNTCKDYIHYREKLDKLIAQRAQESSIIGCMISNYRRCYRKGNYHQYAVESRYCYD